MLLVTAIVLCTRYLFRVQKLLFLGAIVFAVVLILLIVLVIVLLKLKS